MEAQVRLPYHSSAVIKYKNVNIHLYFTVVFRARMKMLCSVGQGANPQGRNLLCLYPLSMLRGVSPQQRAELCSQASEVQLQMRHS